MEDNKGLGRDEILAKSREENKYGDEREQQALYRAAYAATAVGMFIYGIMSVVLSLMGRCSYEMNVVTFAIIGTMYTVWGLKSAKRRRLLLTAGIVCTVSSVTSLVCWILQLCGIV